MCLTVNVFERKRLRNRLRKRFRSNNFFKFIVTLILTKSSPEGVNYGEASSNTGRSRQGIGY